MAQGFHRSEVERDRGLLSVALDGVIALKTNERHAGAPSGLCELDWRPRLPGKVKWRLLETVEFGRVPLTA